MISRRKRARPDDRTGTERRGTWNLEPAIVEGFVVFAMIPDGLLLRSWRDEGIFGILEGIFFFSA